MVGMNSVMCAKVKAICLCDVYVRRGVLTKTEKYVSIFLFMGLICFSFLFSLLFD